jgi:hypothetical protein
MTLKEFATANRLRFKIVDGEDVVIGKGDSQIYDFGEGQFGALVMHGKNAIRWNSFRKQFTDLGFEIIQDGDLEGCGLFDPKNQSQVKVAIKAIEARRKRVMTPEQREIAQTRLAPFLKTKQTCTPEGKTDPKTGGVL